MSFFHKQLLNKMENSGYYCCAARWWVVSVLHKCLIHRQNRTHTVQKLFDHSNVRSYWYAWVWCFWLVMDFWYLCYWFSVIKNKYMTICTLSACINVLPKQKFNYFLLQVQNQGDCLPWWSDIPTRGKWGAGRALIYELSAL